MRSTAGNGSHPRQRQRVFAFLNAQWRGGSTLGEQLIFSTTVASPFLLDEPAKAMWQDENHHSVAIANFNALRCDFHQFNHSLLLSWQHWRGEFTRQRRLLNYKSFPELQNRCRNAGNGGHLRAIKTIRMSGELGQLARECSRLRDDGANFSCVLLQMVRHPLSTLRSEIASSKLPQARGVKYAHVVPSGSGGWAQNRASNMTEFCAPILRDVETSLALQRRAARRARRVAALERLRETEVSGVAAPKKRRSLDDARRELSLVPKVMLLRYDELLRRPEAIAREAHGLMRAFTSEAKLSTFVKGHLAPNYTSSGGTPPPTLNSSTQKLRKRLKFEFGTGSRPRACNTLQPMLEWPVCAELVRLMSPLYVC